MNKILMIAVFNERSTNNSQADGFEKEGYQVIRYNYRERGRDAGRENRDEEIINLCKEHKPLFVFFSKCDCVDIRVILECNTVSKTVFWFMDPMHNWNDGITKKVKHCSHSFFALQEPFKESQKHSGTTHFLFEGFDSKLNKPLDVPYKHDVSFIGSLRGERRTYFNAIKFHNYKGVWGIDHSEAVSASKVNLNFTDGGTSDRTYKVLASKGFLLTQPWEDMEKYFRVGKDLDVFNSPVQLQHKIDCYLKDENLRNSIANSGYDTVQKFSRDNWAKKIVEIIK